jgi:hypothetical protein
MPEAVSLKKSSNLLEQTIVESTVCRTEPGSVKILRLNGLFEGGEGNFLKKYLLFSTVVPEHVLPPGSQWAIRGLQASTVRPWWPLRTAGSRSNASERDIPYVFTY